MEPLDHGPFLAAGKFDQSAGVRSRDAESVDHLSIIESQESACRHRGAKSTGQSGRVKTSLLERVPRGNADARHHFARGDKAREQRFTVGLRFFCHRKGGEKCRRTGMYAGPRLAHVVELEGV